MPEETPPNDGQQQQQQDNQQQGKSLPFVGKYETQEAFEQGIREIAKTVDYPLGDGPLIGESGRFKSVSEATAAYKAFARMRTQRGEEKPAEAGGENQGDAKPGDDDKQADDVLAIGDIPADDMDVEAVLQSAGLKNDDVVKQWLDHGKLTDDQYAKLQAALPGVSRKMIDGHMKVQQLALAHVHQTQANIKAEAAKIAGGEQQLQNLLAGARRFVPADEVDELNQMLANPRQYKMALKIIKQHHLAYVGADKSQTTIDADGGSTPDAPLKRGSKEYYDAIKRAGRGDKAAQDKLRKLANA